MLDTFNLPVNTGKAEITILNCVGSQVGLWQTYKKPRGKSMLYIMVIGPGAGGGGGFTRAASVSGGGGGGGGSGGIATGIFPLALLPDFLYCQISPGGAGGAAGANGTTPFQTYVALRTDEGSFAPSNVLIDSGTGNPTGGGGGTGAAGGAAGTGATVAVIGNMPLAGLGLYNILAGQNGTVGGNPAAAGGSIAIPVTGINVMGGTGGGGVTVAEGSGGPMTSISNSLVSEMAPIGAAANIPGSGGGIPNRLFFSFSGMGGGSSNTGVGQNGGHGGFGCGGGGGGAGTTGGTGGDGGPGLAIFIAW